MLQSRGLSVNALMLEALQAEIERVRGDEEFVEKVRALTEWDRQILDRLAG
jgi:glutamate-1-semialdehyde aminotransferase